MWNNNNVNCGSCQCAFIHRICTAVTSVVVSSVHVAHKPVLNLMYNEHLLEHHGFYVEMLWIIQRMWK